MKEFINVSVDKIENLANEHFQDYIKPYKMLFAGFVGQHKGVPDLIKAIKRSGLTSEEIQLTVIGSGDIDEMKMLVSDLGMNGHVTFTGRVSEEEKTRLFNKHHIFALPSHGEGQPISILEGMASGMAILSTKVGSIPEVIKEENGIFYSLLNRLNLQILYLNKLGLII